jgi:hypothetical protein
MASKREELINSIMKNKYGDDDPKYDSTNRAFLESLTLTELERLDDEDDFIDDDFINDEEYLGEL